MGQDTQYREGAIPEGKKMKANQEEEVGETVPKFRFNKKGKLTKEEVNELSRTNQTSFSWLKPVKHVIEVVEPEEWDQVEDMEALDNFREERLDRVRRRQLEWATKMLRKDIFKEMIGDAIIESEMKVCTKVVETSIVDECW